MKTGGSIIIPPRIAGEGIVGIHSDE